MYYKKSRIFGPQLSEVRSYQSQTPYQNGYGLGSFFSKILPKIGKKALGFVKKIGSSKLVKDSAKQLMNSAVEGGGEVLAAAISGENPSDVAKAKFNEFRQDLAQTIRTGTKRKSEKSSDVRRKPRKKVRLLAKKALKPRNKRYSLFDDDEVSD